MRTLQALTLVLDTASDSRQVLQRSELQVLIISKDEQYVRVATPTTIEKTLT